MWAFFSLYSIYIFCNRLSGIYKVFLKLTWLYLSFTITRHGYTERGKHSEMEVMLLCHINCNTCCYLALII